jgi:hypothetical protein
MLINDIYADPKKNDLLNKVDCNSPLSIDTYEY